MEIALVARACCRMHSLAAGASTAESRATSPRLITAATISLG
jgi:hypothetical protein